jgi:hypothetical protein
VSGVLYVQALLDRSSFNKTINCERYVQVILGQFFPELTEEERLYDWFRQESANAHTASMSMQPVSDIFGNSIISSSILPAHSPNLNSCDFFLLGVCE